MLLEGGVFLYPADAAGQGKLTSGKLRLQYEAAPIALVAEAAGGRARRRLLRPAPLGGRTS
jgi:fructose-1,6-bisphosphatase I